MMLRINVAVLLLVGSLSVVAQHTHQHSPASAPATAPSFNNIPPPAKTCRKGAFTDAMALINSSVRASRNLSTTATGKSSIAFAELDSILGIAIGQASAEFDCVKGSLVLGYDKNFADTAKLAWNQAKARNMSPVYIEQALQLSKQIELSGAPAGLKK